MRPTATRLPLLAAGLLALVLAGPAAAQSPLVIEPGLNAIPNVINGDTNAPADRVYVLRRGRTYLYTEQLLIERPITIRAEDGDGPRPIIQPNFDPNVDQSPRPFRALADFSLSGVFIYGRDTAGRVTDNAMIRIGAEGVRVTVDDCRFSANRASAIRIDEGGVSVIVTNSMFDNIIAPAGRESGYAIRIETVRADSVIIRNSTMWNMNNLTIFNRGIVNYVEVSHSTFYGIGVRSGFRDAVDAFQTETYVFQDNIVYNPGYYGNTPAGIENENDRRIIGADSLVVTDENDMVVSIEAPELVLRNGNFYIDDVVTAAFPDTITAFRNFDQTIEAAFAEGLAGENTFFSEELDFATAPDPASYAARQRFARENMTEEGAPFLDLDPAAPANGPASPPAMTEVDFSYSTSARSYTAASGGCPLGDLNWFPDVDAAACLRATPSQPGPAALAFGLRAAPNPTSGRTALVFDLDRASDVTVSVYDVLGREVMALDAALAAGAGRRVDLDVSGVPSGVYVVRVRAEAGADVRTASQQITVVR